MKVHHIPIKETAYFSKLICDYCEGSALLNSFYNHSASLKGLSKQMEEKSGFLKSNRVVLSEALKQQYEGVELSHLTKTNLDLLADDNTFTITTGHQLNIFTGPLYFLYKIVSVINLTKRLKKAHPEKNFVPVYWMATEDHDFDEINFFRCKGQKISFEKEVSGAVGRISTEGMDAVFMEFSALIGTSKNATFLKELFQKAYLEHTNLTAATRYLVNTLFGDYGLVIVDGDDIKLKNLFAPIVKEELTKQTSFKEVSSTNQKLESNYKIQVNPRLINLFYLKDNLRERIIEENGKFIVNNTHLSFSENEILEEVDAHPERFSPNVILRPVYQEVILPNLCYIGGGGELAYWMQLKSLFDKLKVPYPILMLRNSVLLATEKQFKKIEKLGCNIEDFFKKQNDLVNNKVREHSDIKIDFSKQKAFLQKQFEDLKVIAQQTDASFIGAVNAQEKKQLNGLDKLEKRLLKAQKRKYADELSRLKGLQNELFPNQSLEERTKNFSDYYLQYGVQLIPMLLAAQDPLNSDFTIIEC